MPIDGYSLSVRQVTSHSPRDDQPPSCEELISFTPGSSERSDLDDWDSRRSLTVPS